MASRVSERSCSRGQPSIWAPFSITSREQPAAKFRVLYFFFRDFKLTSPTCLLGWIRATAPMRPVNSSVAKSTFSISCSGFTSLWWP